MPTSDGLTRLRLVAGHRIPANAAGRACQRFCVFWMTIIDAPIAGACLHFIRHARGEPWLPTGDWVEAIVFDQPLHHHAMARAVELPVRGKTHRMHRRIVGVSLDENPLGSRGSGPVASRLPCTTSDQVSTARCKRTHWLRGWTAHGPRASPVGIPRVRSPVPRHVTLDHRPGVVLVLHHQRLAARRRRLQRH